MLIAAMKLKDAYSLEGNLRPTSVQFHSVQSLSHVRLFMTPWTAACQASLSITDSQSSLKLTSIKSVMPSSHLILCRPLGDRKQHGMTEDEIAGWYHRLDGREFEWTLGVGDGQGGLACCDSWGRKESDTTEWLNWTELNRSKVRLLYFMDSKMSSFIKLVILILNLMASPLHSTYAKLLRCIPLSERLP